MLDKICDSPANAIKCGVEDKFYYEISDACIGCGACVDVCPAGAIGQNGRACVIDSQSCIDCGTCSVVCPTGAARRAPYIRESISFHEMDMDKCYFNPWVCHELI